MYKSEQLEVTQGFVCPKEEYAAFCTWAKNTLPFIDTPSVASHLFGAWIGSARHRLTTEARMAEAVEALEPFSKALEKRQLLCKDDEFVTWSAITVGDLRKARQALAKIRSQSDG